MSGKLGTNDAKVLKKARSFRDDLKHRIIRRNPSTPKEKASIGDSVQGERLSTSSSAKSPKLSKAKLNRGSSFKEDSKTEQLQKTDVEKLKTEDKKVHHALLGLRVVVEKGMLHMLPGSATVVLETVMEVLQLLGKFFVETDSSALLSAYKQVNQSVANLMKWSDEILLRGDTAVDTDVASKLIQSIEQGMKDLMKLATEKLERKSSQKKKGATSRPKSPDISVPNGNARSDSKQRSSLPDIILTPQEEQGLQKTMSDGVTKPQPTVVKVLKSGDSERSDGVTEKPPPKPPLPANFSTAMVHHRPTTSHPANAAPPLPPKKRTGSSSSIYDNYDSSAVDTLWNQVAIGKSGSLSDNSYNPADLLRGSTVSDNSGVFSDVSSDVSETKSTNVVDFTPGELFSQKPRAMSDDLTLKADSRPESVSSQLSRTSNADGTSLVDHVNVMLDKNDARLSRYDNFTDNPMIVSHQQQQTEKSSHFQIQNLTQQIEQLTVSVESDNFTLDTRPPLPVKKSSPSLSSTNASPAKLTTHRTTGNGELAHQEVLMGHKSMVGRAMQHHTVIGGLTGSEDGILQPPPLPPKKKNVEAYMQIVGQYTKPNISDLSRHSINAVSFYQTMWHQHQMEMFHSVNFSRSNTLSIMSDLSSGRNSDMFSVHSASSDDTAPPTPPFPPRLPCTYEAQQNNSSSLDIKARAKPLAVKSSHDDSPLSKDSTGEAKVVQVIVQNGSEGESDSGRKSSVSSGSVTTSTSENTKSTKDRESIMSDVSSVLEDMDVAAMLVRQKQGEDEPDIRGGSLDALIVHATAAGRKEILYQEAFLTTYRTFIKSRDLIERLLYRYNYFCRMDTKKKKVARNTFSLLVRVVDELCTEIDNDILQALMDIVHQLVSQGELMLAKILRRKVLEKVEQKKQMQLDNTHHLTLWESHHMTTKQYSLLEFKPESLAEQMTLLDAELFQKIEIPEVLLWAKDQNEEQSPNLTKFTEHFNKTSYWCRTQILQQEDAKEREKYLVKFIKIMKFLRKFNNFNSYLAILSAVDSAPVRRLEWQKQNVEALQELCHLIDSSSSFRAYRQVLAETEPPCIPYIGIILQDLTFVHIGNPDYLSEGCINFSKRWQQFGILDNMKRFKAAEYNFKKNHKIIAFFNGFDENLSEESLWQISEVLKPRGSRKKPET